MAVRERIPLDFLFDKEEKIQENWIDNPEPAAFTILFRIFFSFFCYYLCTFLIFNHLGSSINQ